MPLDDTAVALRISPIELIRAAGNLSEEKFAMQLLWGRIESAVAHAEPLSNIQARNNGFTLVEIGRPHLDCDLNRLKCLL